MNRADGFLAIPFEEYRQIWYSKYQINNKTELGVQSL